MARNAPLRTFIPEVFACAPAPLPSSSPLRTLFIYSHDISLCSFSSRSGGSRARESCGRVSRWRRASCRRARRSPRWARRVRGCGGRSQGLSAAPRGAENAPSSARAAPLGAATEGSSWTPAEQGPAAPRAGDRPRGAAFAPRTLLGGELYVPLESAELSAAPRNCVFGGIGGRGVGQTPGPLHRTR